MKLRFRIALLLLLCLLPAAAQALEASPLPSGYTSLSWEEAETAGDYYVLIQHQPQGMTQLAAQVSAPRCALRDLLPGETYLLRITDGEGTELDRCVYEVPQAVFEEFPINAIVTPKKHTRRGYTEIRTFSARELAAQEEGVQFGAGLRLTHSPLRTARSYELSFAVFLPDGDTYYCGQGSHTMPAGRSSSVINFDDFTVMFRYILSSRGDIPTGTWRYAVYADGLFAAEAEFQVEP